jgi:cytochrome oxidase Cu insertion factor (SCO1/SenC/PrrC family)
MRIFGFVSKGRCAGSPCPRSEHFGGTVPSEDFRGELQLIFFGYTVCPDMSYFFGGYGPSTGHAW